MGPFIRKIAAMDKAKFPKQGEWAFLSDWETPIVEANLEHLSERGRKDAKVSFVSRRHVSRSVGPRQIHPQSVRKPLPLEAEGVKEEEEEGPDV